MKKIEKLENEVKQLNQSELVSFRKWFFEFDTVNWDEKISADIKAGKLDALADEALKSHKAGKSKEL